MLEKSGPSQQNISDLASRLGRITTPLVNDTMREMNFLDQALPSSIHPRRDDMVVFGEAFTVRSCREAVSNFADVDISARMALRANILDDLRPGVVVVWDTDGDERCAQWGGMMTRMAKKKGCVGAVIDGGMRDTVDVLGQDFPIFSRYRTSNGVLGRHRWVDYEVVLRIGDVLVHPGDYVLGDIDGALVIPRDLIAEVVTKAERKFQDERGIEQMISDSDTAEGVVKQGGIF